MPAQDGATKLLTMAQRGLPLGPTNGDFRRSTPKITPEQGWPQAYLYMQQVPFPSQHPWPCMLILPHLPLRPSTHGTICPPTLPSLPTTQEITFPPILHRCNTHTNLAQAKALSTILCGYM